MARWNLWDLSTAITLFSDHNRQLHPASTAAARTSATIPATVPGTRTAPVDRGQEIVPTAVQPPMAVAGHLDDARRTGRLAAARTRAPAETGCRLPVDVPGRRRGQVGGVHAEAVQHVVDRHACSLLDLSQ
jgi:hypothetical protein